MNILFLPGTEIHFKQMSEIANSLSDIDIYFAPFFADGKLELLRKTHIFDFIFRKTPLGNSSHRKIKKIILESGFKTDEKAKKRDYDLVVVPSDIYLPSKIIKSKIVLIQEGGLYPDNFILSLVKIGIAPRFFANTAALGLSDKYEFFCVASEEYRKFFIERGIKSEKLRVTGISYYDNFEKYRVYPKKIPKLPKKYVLACMSPSWESLGLEWDSLISKARRKAKELKIPLVVKVHPREERYQIRRLRKQNILVYQKPTAEYFAASAKYAFVQSSTSIYSLIHFGIPTESTKLDIEKCKKLMAWQNNGTSAKNIAAVCREILNM